MRGHSACLYLVGPPEDELRLRLRLSSVPGRARPSFAVAYAPRLVIIGRVFGLGGGARQHRPQHQEGVVIHRHQVVAQGVALQHKQICLVAAPGYGGA